MQNRRRRLAFILCLLFFLYVWNPIEAAHNDTVLGPIETVIHYQPNLDYPSVIKRLENKDAHPPFVWHLNASDFEFQSQSMADTKYFSEHPEWIHLDARFVPQGFEFNHTILHETLGVVLRSFSSFCLENEIPYWLAHGTLIGWYWGQKMLPWDGDVDLQTSMKGLSILAKFNQTLIQDRFLIDVNPNYVDRRGRRRTMDDTWTNNNKIDARVIDTHTGIFADITGLSLDRRHGGDDYNLKCKDGHHYRFQSLSPLHQTTYEGIPVLRPHIVADVLAREYTVYVLTRTEFNDYRWDDNLNEWTHVYFFPFFLTRSAKTLTLVLTSFLSLPGTTSAIFSQRSAGFLLNMAAVNWRNPASRANCCSSVQSDFSGTSMVGFGASSFFG